MSFVLLGILNSQAAGGGFEAVYRFQTLGGSGSDEGYSVSLDSANNIYAFGETFSSPAVVSDFLLVKYDSAGLIQWQRILGGDGEDYGKGVDVDSSDNIYVSGWTNSTGSNGNDFAIAKYDSTGTLQWQRLFGGAGSDILEGLVVDSANNVLVVGDTSSSGAGSNDLLVAKYNSSGTIQWQRTLGASEFDDGFGVATDSTNNVYVVGKLRLSSTNYLFVAKYSPSGGIQWQRILGDSNSEIGYAVATDSADNVYVGGQTNEYNSQEDLLLAKYNSSGTIQWQRTLGNADFSQLFDLNIDSADNIYVCGRTFSSTAGSDDFILAKYDSSGTLLWQRILGGSGSDSAYGINFDSSDNIYVIGETASTGEGSNDFLLAVLPNDGSLTGTYVLDTVNMTYAASSLTGSTSILTSAASSATSSSSSLTDSAGIQTSSSITLTEHRVDL